MLQTRKPMSDEAIKAMADRNEHRRQIAKRVLGEKYIAHPSKRIQRIDKSQWLFEPMPYQLAIMASLKAAANRMIILHG